MIRGWVRGSHAMWRSPVLQSFLIGVFLISGLSWAYFGIANMAPADGGNAEERLVVLGAAAAATIAVWGVVCQWAISRRQLTIQFLRELETDQDYIQALRLFNECAAPGHDMRMYAHQTPSFSEINDRKRRAFAVANFNARERAITLVLNTDELIAIGIRNSILDYRLVCAYRRQTIMRRYAVAKAYIDDLRVVSRVPTTYVEMQRLAEKLQADAYHSLL